ncbi:hypothetical protein U9M48_036865 [Paspalum notatum var. saurae]|uniref:CCHC-type domain-containing protein n=1 Tax=Paspalum notatum var. saurae TaxID=547442 RepID=A0AAQ3UFA0_PASNO
MALEVLTKAVLAELMGMIANKATTKIAWDSIKLMNVSLERVRKAKASILRREFDSLKFKDGETVDDFGIRINRIANRPQALPPRFEQIASSIETLLNLEDVTVEELIGRLKATGRTATTPSPSSTSPRMNWSRASRRGSSSLMEHRGAAQAVAQSLAQAVQARIAARSQHRATRGAAVADAVADAAAADPAMTGGNVAGNECRYCGKKGHWARECHKKKQDEQVHVAQTEGGEGEQALLVATTTIVTTTSTEAARSTSSGLHLDESRLYVQLGDRGGSGHTEWILDTRATNHMTGVRSAFSELDTGIHGTVRFGDGSVAGIEGRGTILFKCKNGEHQALGGVYHIPRLTTNVISLGQMEEAGFKILLDQGCLKI